jgi:hypothetical protein
MRFLTWQELHERGVLPSRQHTRRLVVKGIVPAPYRLGDAKRGRLSWSEADIEAYLARKAAERDRPRLRVVGADDNIVPMRREPVEPVRHEKVILRRPSV